MGSGAVLYAKNADVRRAMASTTKIMTCLLVLDTLPLNRVVTASERAAATGEEALRLKAGDQLTVEQLLYALMVKSANDAAVDLAEACSGTEEAFVAQMNAKAHELGLTNTQYTSAHGLDAPGHYSSARDLATLARVAMGNAEFRKLVGTVSYTLSLPNRPTPLTFGNVNKLVGTVPWVTGIKTGFTDNAGFCLVGSGGKGGVSLISVVLGEPSWAPCWADTKALFQYGFNRYQPLVLTQQSVPVADMPVPYHLGLRLQLVTETALQATILKGDKVESQVVVDKQLRLPVQAGEVFGRVQYSESGQALGSVNLVAARSIARITLGTKLVYFWHRFTGWLGRVL